jgi:methylmalonyl-CoA mutase N-terminal domain/subunit
LPRWNTISISGYHIREAGSTAVQEVAFTLANGLAYVEAALQAGLEIDRFAPRLSFFFNAHSNFLEEIAKYRAARRMWANLIKQRYDPTDPRSLMLRFHTQTGGSTLTAQQPLNNVVRVALQALSAVLGGTQSLHTNGYDEALSLPTAEAATLALRTQQIIGFETGVADSADPLAGSYLVEQLTDDIEERAMALLDEVEQRGGAVAAIESGFVQEEIAESAFRWEIALQTNRQKVVGVNFQRDEQEAEVPIYSVDRAEVNRQIARTAEYKAVQGDQRVQAALARVVAAAQGTENLLPLMREALLRGATLGQICETLRDEWGQYRPRY